MGAQAKPRARAAKRNTRAGAAARARELGITVAKTTTKAQLEELIRQAETPAAPEPNGDGPAKPDGVITVEIVRVPGDAQGGATIGQIIPSGDVRVTEMPLLLQLARAELERRMAIPR